MLEIRKIVTMREVIFSELGVAAAMPIILIIWHHLPCPPEGCI